VTMARLRLVKLVLCVSCVVRVGEVRRLGASDKTYMPSLWGGMKSAREARCAFTYREVSEVLFLLPSHGFFGELRVDLSIFDRSIVQLDQCRQWRQCTARAPITRGAAHDAGFRHF